MTTRERPTMAKDLLHRFQSLLVEESGLYVDMERPERLAVAVVERMEKCRVASCEEYFVLILAGGRAAQERKALIERMTVGETYFFRSGPQFAVLKEHILPMLIRERQGSPRTLTVWSAGCSTGEEPYSLAIALLETLPSVDAWKLSILGTDVNSEYLRRAEKAEYGTRSVRQVPPAWLAKHFTERHGKYTLNEAAKRRVRFACHNLAKDPFSLSGMQEVDLLFCRNVMIYFSSGVTKRVVNHFADCLSDGGYFFTGEAETLWRISNRLTSVEFPQTFVYRKLPHAAESRKPQLDLPTPSVLAAHDTPAVPSPQPETRQRECAARQPKIPSDPSEYALGLEAAARKDYARALGHFESVLRAQPNHGPARFAKASLLANQGHYAQAIPLLLEVVRDQALSGEAYYLLGVLYEKTGLLQDAIEAFRRALYVDSSSAMTYFSLGNLYRFDRQPVRARREFQNALKVLEGKPDEAPVPFSDDLTCGDLRAACGQALQPPVDSKS